MIHIQISNRQNRILEIVKEHQPITGEQIAGMIGITRATLRPDLSLLTMSGYLDARPKVGYFFAQEGTMTRDLAAMSTKKVGEVMSVPVIIDDTTSIHAAIITMFLEDVGSLFVTTDRSLSGVLSRKDLLKSAIGGGDITQIPVSMAMTRMPNVIYALENDNVKQAALKLLTHEVDSLPVVSSENGTEEMVIVGRFSKTNVTRLFTEILSK